MLADPVRAQRAFWHLVLLGRDALASVQRGLDSPDPDVRRWSTKAMDHLVDADGLHPDAEAALVHTRDHDVSPAVRKKAGWHAPGGTVHRRTAPVAPRPSRASR
jgi:hypothetical protein